MIPHQITMLEVVIIVASSKIILEVVVSASKRFRTHLFLFSKCMTNEWGNGFAFIFDVTNGKWCIMD